jgi:ParB family transcriptional regulator, chromosome partitioning protein
VSSKPASGLGRGLQALLGEAAAPTSSESGPSRPDGVQEIEIGRIKPSPTQPRVQFDEVAINELAESIAQRGVLQPILVRPSGDGFEIVAGERRWRAAQRAQLHKIPTLVRNIDDSTTAEIALIENVQREDLNAIEEAEGYRQLIERHGHTQDDVAKLVHKSRSHVANLLRLLSLPEFVRKSLLRGDITMGHARALATAEDADELAREVITKGLSVRQTEALAKRVRPGAGSDIARASARRAGQVINADLEALERQLTDMTGLRVQVSHNGTKGALTLHYSSLDQLDMICQRLSGEPI